MTTICDIISKLDLLLLVLNFLSQDKVLCYVPATNAVLIAFFPSFLFAAAINSTNEANKAASTHR